MNRPTTDPRHLPPPHASRRSGWWPEAVCAGTLASVLSSAVLGWAGQREQRSVTLPLNAVSHWWWGRRGLHARGFSARHTVLGYAIHHGAALGWAALHAAVMRGRPGAHRPGAVVAGAAITSAVACVVDFKCTPERFTPGFEHHLSRPALAGVYAAFAAGLALGAWAVRAERPQGARDRKP